jgi:hypothetical protein
MEKCICEDFKCTQVDRDVRIEYRRNQNPYNDYELKDTMIEDCPMTNRNITYEDICGRALRRKPIK